MATAEQWIKCTQAQKDELNELYSVRNRYMSRRRHVVEQLNKARKLMERKTYYNWGLPAWYHPIHVRYEAARDVLRLEAWLNTEGAELAHTIDNLNKAIAEVLREAEQGHEQRQLDLVGEMFPQLTTTEQRREALHLLKGNKS